MTDLTPGTRVKVNDSSPWPQRRGLSATVVDTFGAEHLYPIHGLGRNEVIIYIEDDPLDSGIAHMLPNGKRWSCVMYRDNLDAIHVPAAGDDRAAGVVATGDNP